jgi:hypothetical protein
MRRVVAHEWTEQARVLEDSEFDSSHPSFVIPKGNLLFTHLDAPSWPSLLIYAFRGLAQFDCPEGEKTTEGVVHGLLKVLFATEISFRGENGCVSQEGSVRSHRRLHGTALRTFCEDHGSQVQLHPFATSPNHVPYGILRDSLPHGVPWRLTARKIRPTLTLAAIIHRPTASLTQLGIGAV